MIKFEEEYLKEIKIADSILNIIAVYSMIPLA